MVWELTRRHADGTDVHVIPFSEPMRPASGCTCAWCETLLAALLLTPQHLAPLLSTKRVVHMLQPRHAAYATANE